MSSVSTTILISNLHCGSCVNTIREILSSLSPPPTSIITSIVSQSVTVEHPPELSSDVIKDALDEAGFDLVSTPKLQAYGIRRSPSYRLDWLNKKRQKHTEQCLLCQQEHAASSGVGSTAGTLAAIPSQRTSLTLTPHSTSPFSRDNKDLSDAGTSSMTEGPFNVAFSVGGMTCASCVGNVTRALEELPGVSDVSVNLVSKSATARVERRELTEAIREAVEDAGYEADLVSVEPVKVAGSSAVADRDGKKSSDGPFYATFSVGGMTCASCVGNVTNAVVDVPGVSDVAVNLVGKSATATLEKKQLVDAFVKAVEDAGYDCLLVSIEPLKDTRAVTSAGPREIALRADGMFCKHCPDKITAALQTFGDRVTIIQPIASYNDPQPIIRLSYTPSPPDFTIRTIINRIASAKSPPFEVSIARNPSLEERARSLHAQEQRAILFRLISSVIIAIPTFIIGVVFMSLVPQSNHTRQFFMRPLWTGNASRAQWAMFFLATPAMFYSAGQFHRRSLKEIWGLWKPKSRTPILRRFIRFGSMNLLVSMGVSIAYFSSIALLALAASQAPSLSGMGDTTTYFDSVVFLSMFLLAGRFLEAYSKGRTADAIDALGKLRPTDTLLLVPENLVQEKLPREFTSDDIEKGVPPDEELRSERPGMRIQKVNVDLLEIGDVVRVPHGGSPPADGIIVSEHEGSFDESSLTGESKPVKKESGDRVFVGTINRGKIIDVKIHTLGGETMLDRIVKVVREGQAKRAPIERVADVLTGYFVPVITLLAILVWIIWLALGLSGALPQDYLDIPIGGWTVWALEFAIAVFVVACPCGIGLAAPTALLVGSGLAAKFGILVRGGGEAFQEAAQLDLIVFDKTGTLTLGGEPRITDTFFDLSDKRWGRGDVLNAMHALESASSHPLATAVRSFCEGQEDIKITDIESSDLEETPGKGLKAVFPSLNTTAIIGNEFWMQAHGVELTGIHDEKLLQWKSEGKSVILFAMNDNAKGDDKYSVLAILAASDELRPEAKDVVRTLQKQGLATWMISGDNEITARAVAKTVGIPETNVIAGVLPHQKAEKVAWLQQVGMKRALPRWQRLFGVKRLNERCIVAMVGDGINDAPALTTADVGIAIGSGSDVAISSASFILIQSNLKSILTLVDLSRKVFNRVKFNFGWALIYNLVALPIAAGAIYPAGHARLNPVWASLAMALSSVSVVASSLLLRLYREPKIQFD